MPNWLGATGRCFAIFTLGFLLVLAVPVTWAANRIGLGALNLSDYCVRAIQRLQEQGRAARASRLSDGWGV